MSAGASNPPTPEENPSSEVFLDPTKSMELLWQGQKGDALAVNELFTRYLPRMRRVMRIKITGPARAHLDPEDVLQETMMIAVRKLGELEVRTPASIMQWLAKIADYQIKNRLDYLRAEKRDAGRERRIKNEDASSDSSASGVIVPFQGPTPSQYYARTELEELIDAQLEVLDPPDYREVILMRDYYESDWETIRATLGRPNVDAVQDLYHRAHKRLRERMRNYLR
jgi:RNA polymerase sigma factor (sigma-70 family)